MNRGTLASVDPGLRKAGLALWADGHLVGVSLVLVPDQKEMPRALLEQAAEYLGGPPARWLVERPRSYPGRTAPEPNLVKIRAVIDRLRHLRMVRGLKTIAPSDWKGNVPKDVHRGRIFAALRPGEKAMLREVDQHDVVDAVGLGLFGYGRLLRGGVDPGLWSDEGDEI